MTWLVGPAGIFDECEVKALILFSAAISQHRNLWRSCQTLDRLGDPSMIAF